MNMSYCRFQNTNNDLRDCVDHVGDKLSEDEHEARKSLIKNCVNILDEVGIEVCSFELMEVMERLDKVQKNEGEG